MCRPPRIAISSLAELRATTGILQEIRLPIHKDVKIGVMIEVPSAVTIADQLAQVADFLYRNERPGSICHGCRPH